MILCGLDEAGLGPRLGPFCACLTVFQTGRNQDSELYEILVSLLTPERTDGRIRIADSKRIYSPAAGLRELENGVVALLGAAGVPWPLSFRDLIGRLCPPQDVDGLAACPWFDRADRTLLPLHDDLRRIGDRTEGLSDDLRALGVSVGMPALRFVPARRFNRELDRGGGKGEAVYRLIAPLIREVICPPTGRPAQTPALRLTVDRQGGRRRYGAHLAALMPAAPLRAVEEGPKRSVYTVGDTRIEYLVGADGLRLETAFASMVAKYTREIAMGLFNRWWEKKLPGIRPTAGYPADAKRFLAELEAAGIIPADPDELIRRL